jgi:hypothetical protein
MTPGQLVRLRRPLRARDRRLVAPAPYLDLEPCELRVRAVWGSLLDLERVLSRRQLQTEDDLVLMHVPVSAVEAVMQPASTMVSGEGDQDGIPCEGGGS